MSRLKRVKIKKSDKHRALLTETLPFETPIIFASSGIYDRVVSDSSADILEKKLVEALVTGKPGKVGGWTEPLRYKVRKNASEFRRLALMHPRAQWKVASFYSRREALLLSYCAKSPASIRAPARVASSYFRKGVWEDIYKYRTGTVATTSGDQGAKHSPSYFAYRGVDRLYKFFESREYFDLEKKYPCFWTLDVSKCFDSIYTHSLSWAVKGKEFTKRNLGVSSTFAQEFDSTMCYANHSETNGIIIGPEVSRIFSEIILQRVDVDVIDSLRDENLVFDGDYTFKRYVDDVFIFSKDHSIAEAVYTKYSDVLMGYNLHANKSKSVRLDRPFVSEKSRLTFRAAECTENLLEVLFDKFSDGSVAPNKIRSPWRVTRSYIDALKSVCSESKSSYDDVSAYVIGMFLERVKRLVSVRKVSDDSCGDFLSVILVFLDVMYFVYGVSPSVSSSYRLGCAVLLINSFSKRSLPAQYPTIAQKIYDLTWSHLSELKRDGFDLVDGFLPLESLNVLLAARDLGGDYLLPPVVVGEIFSRSQSNSIYFRATSCLYYIRDDEKYQEIKHGMVNELNRYFSDMSAIETNAECCLLFLDMVCCPYVDISVRRRWLVSAIQALKLSMPSAAELAAFLASAPRRSWHIKWTDVDLLNLLEKKELKQIY